MSGYVPPRYGHDAEEELEELGDEAIIAQESVLHAPQRRAQVRDEKRSVVISDHPQAIAANEPSSYPPPRSRSRAEATVVIRDRRKIEAMRQEILHRQRSVERRADKRLFVWAGAALAAFLFGALAALFIGAGREVQAPALAAPGASVANPAPPALARPTPAAEVTPAATSEPKAVDLEDLPVERTSRKR